MIEPSFFSSCEPESTSKTVDSHTIVLLIVTQGGNILCRILELAGVVALVENLAGLKIFQIQ